MKIKCKYVSADEAGGEIYAVYFEAEHDNADAPYVLIQRAFLEEEDEPSLIYVETHDERLIGHYPAAKVELTRNRLVLRLPPPADETIDVEFTTSDKNYRNVARTLGIILQKDDITKEAEMPTRRSRVLLTRVTPAAGQESRRGLAIP